MSEAEHDAPLPRAASSARSCCGTSCRCRATHGHRDAARSVRMTRRCVDPVCGMSVDPATAKHARASRPDLPFLLAPAAAPNSSPIPPNISTRQEQPPPEMPAGTIYTCPMHPEIRQAARAAARSAAWRWSLRSSSLDAGPNPELADMTRRFWIGAVLALPVFVLEMGGHLVGGHGLIDPALVELDPVRARDAGRAVGRLAVLRARLAVAA